MTQRLRPRAQAMTAMRWRPRPGITAVTAMLMALVIACWSSPVAVASVDILGATTTGTTTEFTVKTQILILMTLLGLLPVLVLMMTSFTRFRNRIVVAAARHLDCNRVCPTEL